jgi:hypothetical protein
MSTMPAPVEMEDRRGALHAPVEADRMSALPGSNTATTFRRGALYPPDLPGALIQDDDFLPKT